MTLTTPTIVRHVALLKWHAGAAPEAIRAAQAAFAGFMPHMPGMLGFHVASNIGIDVLPELGMDCVHVADFATVADFKAYQAHPLHAEYGRKHIHDVLADARTVQLAATPQHYDGSGAAIRHAVLVQWKPGLDAAHGLRAQAAFPAMAAHVPGIVRASVGPNLGIDGNAARNWDFAFVIDFESVAAVKAYWANPEHSAYADAFVRPFARDSRRIQCRWPA